MDTAHILLVEDSQGGVVGVRFASVEAARAWEDEHDLTAVGCVPLVSRRDALTER